MARKDAVEVYLLVIILGKALRGKGLGGTSIQSGACKEYQQCMNQCINAHNAPAH